MKYNKSLFLLMTLIFVFVLAACGGSSNENKDTEETVTLTMADFFPAEHEIGTQMTQGWADAVEKETDGLVKVDVYPGESLLDSEDILEGVISGSADIGQSSIAYNIGRFPILGALYLGGFEYKDSIVSSKVANDIIQEYGEEELEDVKLLFAYGVTPGDLQTTEPVKTLEDIKGMEIRATGHGVENIEALGGIPIGMPMSEAYESLSKGVVKGNLAPAEVLEGWNTAEVTEYITKTDFLFNSVHMYTMNLEVWDSLSKDIQDKIDNVSEKMYEDVASKMFLELNESGMNYAVENFDIEVIELPDDEKTKWIDSLQPIHDEYIEKLDEEGLPGEEIMNRIKELAKKYNNERE